MDEDWSWANWGNQNDYFTINGGSPIYMSSVTWNDPQHDYIGQFNVSNYLPLNLSGGTVTITMYNAADRWDDSGDLNMDNATLSATYTGADPPPSVPEPCSMLLLGSGLVGLGAFRKRFKKA